MKKLQTSRRIKERAAALFCAVAACAILISGCGKQQNKNAESKNELPDFKYTALDGKEYSQKDIEKGPAIAGFLVSWCAPCAGELLALQEIQDEFGKNRLPVLVFSYEDVSKFSHLVDSLKIDIPILQADSSLFTAMHIDAIPTRILLYDGSEIRRMVGAPSFEETAFQDEIRDKLGIPKKRNDSTSAATKK